MHPEKEIKLGIKSNLQDVYLIGMLVETLCSLSSFSDDDLYWLKLCVIEAVNNSILHAYNGESGHEVEVLFRIQPDRVELHVRDTGVPMDVEAFESERSYSEYEAEGEVPQNLGIPIIKEVMDEVDYRREDGVNQLIMVKKIR